MTASVELDRLSPSATDGEIAAINLESARRSAWARFARDPRRAGVAEDVLDTERLLTGFLGDFRALDRLDILASRFARADDTFRAALMHAAVASSAHRFEDARAHLARAADMGGPRDAIERQALALDQACGVRLDAVLATRRRVAAASGRLEDLIALGALLADLENFDEAAAIYHEGYYSYDETSPFPLAWLCFQLGVLWGELIPEPQPGVAELWYRRALTHLPGYVRARVHLAEIYLRQARSIDAQSLLLAVLSSHDPEVPWRLAEALGAQGRLEEAESQLDAARRAFDELLRRHPLAFADHAAEFYVGPGGDCQRAVQLARMNVLNRPTRRAVMLAQAIATHAAATGCSSWRDEAGSE